MTMEPLLRTLSLRVVHFHVVLLFTGYGNAEEGSAINVIKGESLTLKCPLRNSTEDVFWYLRNDTEVIIALCLPAQGCPSGSSFQSEYHKATRSETFSTLNIINGSSILSESGVKMILCTERESEEQYLQRFYVNVINPEQFKNPICNILPSESITELTIYFVCEANTFQEIVPQLNIDGLNYNHFSDDTLSRATSEISLSNFKTMQQRSCQLSIKDVDVNRSCTFPRYVEVNLPEMNGKDIEFICNAGTVVQPTYSWRLLDPSSGNEVNIENRSWTRDRKKKILLQNISKNDFGRVIECRVNHEEKIVGIGFAVITSQDVDNTSLPEINGKVYKILAFFFLVLFVFSLTFTCVLYMIISKKALPSRLPCFFCETSDRKESQVSSPVGDDHEASELQPVTTTAMPGRQQEMGKPKKSCSANANWNNDNQHTIVSSTSVLQPEQSEPDDHTYFIVDKSLPSSSSSSSLSSNLSHLKQCPIGVRDSDGYDIVNVPERKTPRSFDMDYDVVGDCAGDHKTREEVHAFLCEKRTRGREDVAWLYGEVKK